MAIFRETKPRKAKYGFKLDMHDYEAIFLQAPDLLKACFGNTSAGLEWWQEMPNSMGSVSLLIYINDEALYNKFKALNDAS